MLGFCAMPTAGISKPAFLAFLTCGCFSFLPGTLITVLEKLLSQKAESEHAGCLVICAALNNAAKVRELLQKYPDKASLEDIPEGLLFVAPLENAVIKFVVKWGRGWEEKKNGFFRPCISS